MCVKLIKISIEVQSRKKKFQSFMYSPINAFEIEIMNHIKVQKTAILRIIGFKYHAFI